MSDDGKFIAQAGCEQVTPKSQPNYYRRHLNIQQQQIMENTTLRQQIDRLFQADKLNIKAAKEFQANELRIDAFWKNRVLSPDLSEQQQIDGRPLMRYREESVIAHTASGLNVLPITFSWEDNGSAVAYCHMTLLSGMNGRPFSFQALGDEAWSNREEYVFFTDDTVSPFTFDSIYHSAYHITSGYVDRDNNDSPFQNTEKGPLWLADINRFELHPSRRGNGMGANMLNQALNVIRGKYEIGLFMLNPFPLQYQLGSGQLQYDDDDINHIQFVLDDAKLRQHFMNAYGAESFVADEPDLGIPLMFKGSTALQISKRDDSRRWKFIHFESD